MTTIKIGLGGGCHWCTEAVFSSLKGVTNVQQGYIASLGAAKEYSEAIIIQFNPEIIKLKTIIEIHLRTHNSTSNHSFRDVYRSAVYSFSNKQHLDAINLIKTLQPLFEDPLITEVLSFSTFKASRDEIVDYYYKNPEKPFCEKYINPKLKMLLSDYSNHVSAKIKKSVSLKTTKQ